MCALPYPPNDDRPLVVTVAEEHGGRSVIKSRTAYMQPCSVVVVRYGIGRGSRVVVSWHGAWVTAAVLTLDEADDLIAAIQRAKSPVRDQG